MLAIISKAGDSQIWLNYSRKHFCLYYQAIKSGFVILVQYSGLIAITGNNRCSLFPSLGH